MYKLLVCGGDWERSEQSRITMRNLGFIVLHKINIQNKNVKKTEWAVSPFRPRTKVRVRI